MSCVTNPLKDRPSAYAGAVDAYGAKKAYTGERRVAFIAYDNIGNRTSVTNSGDVTSYTPNNLNQYTQRQISEMINLRGSAETGATVTVKMGSSQSESVTRQEKYWHKQLTSTNDTEAQYPLIKVVGVAKNAATNGDDIVTIETGHVFVAKTPEQFTYDEDGNLLSDGRWTYSWNGENRLVSMETSTNVPASVPVTRLEFVYDYQGRRVSKTVYSWSATNWTEESESTFIYDSWNLVSETCDIQTLGLSTNLYVWGLDLSGSLQGAGGIGGLLFRSDGGTSSVSSVSYVFDANGNVSELLTDAGDIAAHYQYDPYGNTLVSEGELASDNVYRFSTKYTDTETKLLYYGFRYYSPELGRWPSRDPLGEEDCASLYLFVKGDPIRRVDDLGTLTIPWPTPWYTIQRRRRPSNDPRDVWLVGGEKFKYKDTFKVKTMGPPSMGAGETRCCEVMELYEGETHASLSNCSKENMPGWSGQNNPGTDTNGDGLLDNIGLDIGYDELQNPYAARNVTVTVYAFYDFCKGKKCDCVKMETRFAWWAPENGTRR